jgi:hypothetical protein
VAPPGRKKIIISEIDKIKNFAEQFGGSICKKTYLGEYASYKWRCRSGHKFLSKISEIKRRHYFCPLCHKLRHVWYIHEDLCKYAAKLIYNVEFKKIYEYKNTVFMLTSRRIAVIVKSSHMINHFPEIEYSDIIVRLKREQYRIIEIDPNVRKVNLIETLTDKNHLYYKELLYKKYPDFKPNKLFKLVFSKILYPEKKFTLSKHGGFGHIFCWVWKNKLFDINDQIRNIVGEDRSNINVGIFNKCEVSENNVFELIYRWILNYIDRSDIQSENDILHKVELGNEKLHKLLHL